MGWNEILEHCSRVLLVDFGAHPGIRGRHSVPSNAGYCHNMLIIPQRGQSSVTFPLESSSLSAAVAVNFPLKLVSGIGSYGTPLLLLRNP